MTLHRWRLWRTAGTIVTLRDGCRPRWGVTRVVHPDHTDTRLCAGPWRVIVVRRRTLVTVPKT